MLAVVGDLLEDIVVRTATPPAVGTDTAATIDRRPGGSAANVAAAAASTGAAVRLICRVGNDPLGEQLVASVTAGGVDVLAQRAGRTGAVVVLVDGTGERTMLPDRAAAGELSNVEATWIDGVTWLHVPVYSLLSEPIGTAALELVASLRATGVRVSIDASSVAVIDAYGGDRFVALLDEIAPDVVFANEPESVLVPHDRSWVTIVKRGSDPVTVLGDPAADRPYDVDVPPIADVPDTTGAGDAFAAGYCVAAIAGRSVSDAVVAGITLAGDVLRGRHMRRPVPPRPRVVLHERAMRRPRLEFVIDCVDPWAVVEFWEHALGYARHPEADGNPYLGLLPPDGEDAPVVVLQRVPERKSAKNRAHLDLYVAQPEALIQQLVDDGGTRVGEPQTHAGQWFQVMLDPDGNELCVLLEWLPEVLTD